jgi:hypothetical protein
VYGQAGSASILYVSLRSHGQLNVLYVCTLLSAGDGGAPINSLTTLGFALEWNHTIGFGSRSTRLLVDCEHCRHSVMLIHT